MALDTERLTLLSALFHLVEKAQGHPRLKAIGDEAMKHLEEYAESLQQPEPTEPNQENSTHELGDGFEEDDQPKPAISRR